MARKILFYETGPAEVLKIVEGVSRRFRWHGGKAPFLSR